VRHNRLLLSDLVGNDASEELRGGLGWAARLIGARRAARSRHEFNGTIWTTRSTRAANDSLDDHKHGLGSTGHAAGGTTGKAAHNARGHTSTGQHSKQRGRHGERRTERLRSRLNHVETAANLGGVDRFVAQVIRSHLDFVSADHVIGVGAEARCDGSTDLLLRCAGTHGRVVVAVVSVRAGANRGLGRHSVC